MLEEIRIYFTTPIIDKFLLAVLIFYCLDFITGYSRAWKNRNINSNKMRNGVDKAVKYFAFLCIGFTADFVFSKKVGLLFCASSICAIELKSLSENLREMNLNLDWLISLFSSNTKKYNVSDEDNNSIIGEYIEEEENDI